MTIKKFGLLAVITGLWWGSAQVAAAAQPVDDQIASVEVHEIPLSGDVALTADDLTGYNDDCIIQRKKNNDGKKNDDWDQWKDKKKKTDPWNDGWGNDGTQWPTFTGEIANTGDGTWGNPGGDTIPGTQTRGPLGRIIDGIDLNSVINIGQKIWKIIQNGQPVVEFKKRRGHALPKGVTCWADLQGWQPPVVKRYEFSADNARQRRLFQFKYRVVYMYGGSYQGKGRYLTGITVIPEPVKVGWGRGLDVRVQIPTVVNVSRDKNNPIAGAMLEIGWKYQSTFKAQMGTDMYFIRGDRANIRSYQ